MARIKGATFDVFPLHLGGNTFGWATDRDQSFAVLDTFCETNGNVVDTADLYSAWIEGSKGGESEEVFGAYLAAREGAVDDLVIATKSGALGPHRGRSCAATFAAVDAALARLGVKGIDIFITTTTMRRSPWRIRSPPLKGSLL